MDLAETPEPSPFDPRHDAALDNRRRRQERIDRDREQLHVRVAQESTTWCEIEEIVGIDRAYKAILHHAAEAQADLIVMGAQGADGLVKVATVPEHDGGDKQVQAAGPVQLALVGVDTNLPEPIEEDGLAEIVVGLALIQARRHLVAERRAAREAEEEARVFQAANLDQRARKATLAQVRGELGDDMRGDDGAGSNRADQLHEVGPAVDDPLLAQAPLDRRFEHRPGPWMAEGVEASCRQVPRGTKRKPSKAHRAKTISVKPPMSVVCNHGAWIRGVGATTPTPSGVRRCGRNSGVQARACG